MQLFWALLLALLGANSRLFRARLQVGKADSQSGSFRLLLQLVLGRERYDCWTASLGPRPLLFKAAEALLKAVCEHSAFVVTSQWALPPTPAGSTVPGTAEVLAETGLLRKDASFWVWGCRKCLGPLAEAGAGEGGILTCRRYAVAEKLY